eukprot:2929423-Pyramimonas_sp.AAC.1
MGLAPAREAARAEQGLDLLLEQLAVINGERPGDLQREAENRGHRLRGKGRGALDVERPAAELPNDARRGRGAHPVGQRRGE